MMKNTLAILLSLLFIFCLAALSFAGDRQVTGEVLSVDKDAKTITVKGKKGNVTISADDKTKVIEEVMKSLEDVKVGDKVTARYQVDNDKNSAKSVTIRAAKKGKKEARASLSSAPSN